MGDNEAEDRYHSSSSSSTLFDEDCCDSRSPPNKFFEEAADLDSDVDVVSPKTCVILLDNPDSNLCRSDVSSGPETLARCFFRGLPKNASCSESGADFASSENAAGAEEAFGGVVAMLAEADGVTADEGLLALSPVSAASGSAEC